MQWDLLISQNGRDLWLSTYFPFFVKTYIDNSLHYLKCPVAKVQVFLFPFLKNFSVQMIAIWMIMEYFNIMILRVEKLIIFETVHSNVLRIHLNQTTQYHDQYT